MRIFDRLFWRARETLVKEPPVVHSDWIVLFLVPNKPELVNALQDIHSQGFMSIFYNTCTYFISLFVAGFSLVFLHLYRLPGTSLRHFTELSQPSHIAGPSHSFVWTNPHNGCMESWCMPVNVLSISPRSLSNKNWEGPTGCPCLFMLNWKKNQCRSDKTAIHNALTAMHSVNDSVQGKGCHIIVNVYNQVHKICIFF